MEKLRQTPTPEQKRLLSIFMATFDNSQGNPFLQEDLVQLAKVEGDFDFLNTITHADIIFLRENTTIAAKHAVMSPEKISHTLKEETGRLLQTLTKDYILDSDELLEDIFSGVMFRDYIYAFKGRANRSGDVSKFSNDPFASYLQHFAIGNVTRKHNFENSMYTYANIRIKQLMEYKPHKKLYKALLIPPANKFAASVPSDLDSFKFTMQHKTQDNYTAEEFKITFLHALSTLWERKHPGQKFFG